LLSAGRRACRRVGWGGAGVCSCSAPAAARRLPARVRRADARGLISARSHRMKASAGSTRPTQSPSQTPQGGNTTGGKQHKGETAHGETHPPTNIIIKTGLLLYQSSRSVRVDPGARHTVLLAKGKRTHTRPTHAPTPRPALPPTASPLTHIHLG